MKDELFVVQEVAISPQQTNIHPRVINQSVEDCSLFSSNFSHFSSSQGKVIRKINIHGVLCHSAKQTKKRKKPLFFLFCCLEVAIIYLFSSELCVKHVSVGRRSGKISVEIHAFISQFIQRSQEKNIKKKFPLKK